MQYYIYGDPIKMHSEEKISGYSSFWYRHHIPNKEVMDAYPKQEFVKLFKNEEDILNYCNSINDKSALFPSYLRPIYLVECEEQPEHLWVKYEIEFTISEYTPRPIPSNKHTHDAEIINKKCIVETIDVPLSSIQPIKGILKDYDDSPHAKRIKASVDFQGSDTSPCLIL